MRPLLNLEKLKLIFLCSSRFHSCYQDGCDDGLWQHYCTPYNTLQNLTHNEIFIQCIRVLLWILWNVMSPRRSLVFYFTICLWEFLATLLHSLFVSLFYSILRTSNLVFSFLSFFFLLVLGLLWFLYEKIGKINDRRFSFMKWDFRFKNFGGQLFCDQCWVTNRQVVYVEFWKIPKFT